MLLLNLPQYVVHGVACNVCLSADISYCSTVIRYGSHNSLPCHNFPTRSRTVHRDAIGREPATGGQLASCILDVDRNSVTIKETISCGQHCVVRASNFCKHYKAWHIWLILCMSHGTQNFHQPKLAVMLAFVASISVLDRASCHSGADQPSRTAFAGAPRHIRNTPSCVQGLGGS